jgi:kynurenine formamidase
MRAAVFLLLTGCVATAPLPKRVIDLSRTIKPDKANKFEPVVFEHPVYLAMANVTMFNHYGTHYDPPNHIIRGAMGVDIAPLQGFIGPARVIDFRTKPREAALGRADFEGRGIRPGEVVIALVGCPKGPPSRCPYLGGDAARYLASIPIRAFATDNWTTGNGATFKRFSEKGGVDSTTEEFLPEHHAFLSRGIPNFEGLTNIESLLGEKNAVFVAFPIKIENGNGAPVRAAALIY